MVAHAVWSIHAVYSESGVQWRQGWTWVSIARDTQTQHVCRWVHLWLLHICCCRIFMPPVLSYAFPSVLLTHILRSWILLADPKSPISSCKPVPKDSKLCGQAVTAATPLLVPTFCISYFSFAVAKYPTGSNLRTERMVLSGFWIRVKVEEGMAHSLVQELKKGTVHAHLAPASGCNLHP